MAMAGVKYVNNDWLISPRLNGDEQTISFFARSFTLENQQPERMRVLYSTTDTDPANFTKSMQPTILNCRANGQNSVTSCRKERAISQSTASATAVSQCLSTTCRSTTSPFRN